MPPPCPVSVPMFTVRRCMFTRQPSQGAFSSMVLPAAHRACDRRPSSILPPSFQTSMCCSRPRAMLLGQRPLPLLVLGLTLGTQDAAAPGCTRSVVVHRLAALNLGHPGQSSRMSWQLRLDNHQRKNPSIEMLRETTPTPSPSQPHTHQLGKFALVLVLNRSDGKRGGSFLMHHCAQARLALDYAVGHAHLSAESGKPDNELDGINVVSDDHQLRLALLNKSGDVVDAKLYRQGLLLLDLLACSRQRRGGLAGKVTGGMQLMTCTGTAANKEWCRSPNVVCWACSTPVLQLQTSHPGP
jgi:hypothetical protein